MKKIGKGGSRGSGKSKNWSPSFDIRNDERIMRDKKIPRKLSRKSK